ncbi:MAG: hypothetical protein QOI75_183, partial [Pseudonocardiales bacterium]|nr:hypothetical protein [Pseudonocardiales bacterium]
MVTGRDIEYRVDGLTMSGRLALPDGTGPRPAVLIAHEDNGLGDDLDRVRALGRAGLDVLTAEPRTDPGRIAAIGYCFGGTLVLELAR